MTKYDLNDPTDIDILKNDFQAYSENDWEDYIEKAQKHPKFSFQEINMLRLARDHGWKKHHTIKQKQYALGLAERIDSLEEDDKKDLKSSQLLADGHYKLPASHLTLRVAVHDNKWNGSVCKDPEGNTYCSGYSSLLSERIRRRKKRNQFEKEIAFKGKSLPEIDYLPPCFWSINLFGEKAIEAVHDNPAAPNLYSIHENLPAKSMYSWPFAISFTRTPTERAESGAYPKNLEYNRIPRFSAKVHENKSIAFMYANFSNPLTEEEQKYLVVGAGLVSHKQKPSEIPHFGPESEIREIRNRPIDNKKYRHFPSMNWAMQFSFDDYSLIRMPYHEYLEKADELPEDARDSFMDNIKVSITEPELEWCFKYVAMDIGEDEAIYILTKMRKSLLDCIDDGILSSEEMLLRLQKVEQLLEFAWSSRSYFPDLFPLAEC